MTRPRRKDNVFFHAYTAQTKLHSKTTQNANNKLSHKLKYRIIIPGVFLQAPGVTSNELLIELESVEASMKKIATLKENTIVCSSYKEENGRKLNRFLRNIYINLLVLSRTVCVLIYRQTKK